MKSSLSKQSILIIGPKPPPYHGVSVAIEKLLRYEVIGKFSIFHVDLADHRGIQYVNKPDIYDLFLFLKQFYRTLKIVVSKRPSMAYLAICQTNTGFIRDSLFVFLCSLMGCKVVLHLHGGNFRNWYEQKNILFQRFIRIVLNQISAMIVLSSSFKRIFEDLLPRRKIFVVSNGVELIPINSHNDTEPLNPHEKPLTVLYLGTMNKNKGISVLIKSIPFVIDRCPNIRFVFAGPWFDDYEKGKMEAFIKCKGLNRYVKFVGPVQGHAKWDILEHSDIFVFPGIMQEGQPLVVLEAMASGLPILYTNRGCLRETVPDGLNGFEIKIGNSKDLADKILRLADNPSLLKEMGLRNRQRYQENFTSHHYIRNMIDVFKRVSGGPPTAN